MTSYDSVQERDRLHDIAIIPAGVALNVALAVAISALKLPIFADALGTILVILMARRTGRAALWSGIFVGVFSFVLIALFYNPTIIWFAHVQAAIAVYAYYVVRPVVRRIEGHEGSAAGNWFRLGLAGVGLGLVAAALSAPVAALLFSGITPNGPGAVVALLVASGQSLYKAVLASGFSIEPVDKTIQVMSAVLLYLNSPWRKRARPA